MAKSAEASTGIADSAKAEATGAFTQISAKIVEPKPDPKLFMAKSAEASTGIADSAKAEAAGAL